MDNSRASVTSAAEAELIELYQRTRPEPLRAHERAAEAGVAVASLTAALAMAFGLHADRPLHPATAALFVLAFAVSKQVRFAAAPIRTAPCSSSATPPIRSHPRSC
jgi:uncharacterized membrane protein